MYQDLFDSPKEMIKKDAGMKFSNISRHPYLETAASGIGLGAILLQVKDAMECGHDAVPENANWCLIAFASKSLSSVKWHYNIIE